MASKLAFIGGGLLSGIGQGLVEQGKETGKAKRETALQKFELLLKKVEQKNRLEVEGVKQKGRRGLLDASNTAAMERLGLNLGNREDIAAGTNKAAGERRTEASRSAETVANIGAASREKAAEIAAGKATDTTAAEDRIIKRHVQIDKTSLVETVDHEAAALELEANGFTKAAAAQRRKGKAIQKEADRREVQPIVEERVDALDSFWGSDAEDYKQYGGSRSKAVIAITAEEMKNLQDARSGRAGKTPATKSAAAGGDPYTGDAPPPGFPDAKKARDGFWYVRRGGKVLRVQNTEAKPAPTGSGSPRGPR